MEPDTITITDLAVHLPTGAGPSAFGLTPPPPCPLSLTVKLELHPSVVPGSVDADDMAGLGVNYSSVSKALYAALSTGTFAHPAAVLDAASRAAALPAVRAAVVRGRFARALLRADAVYERTYAPTPGPLTCTLENMDVACIVGLHPHERAEKQRLQVDVAVDGVPDGWGHKEVADAAVQYLESSSFGTLESLADTFARHLLALPVMGSGVRVVIRKPSALPFATPSIAVSRRVESYAARGGVSAAAVREAGERAFCTATGGPKKPAAEAGAGAGAATPLAVSTASTASSQPISPARPTRSPARSGASLAALTSTPLPRVFIAVGSNIGDGASHIRRAVRLLQQSVKLVDTSRLYESAPMYVTDQEVFTNGVIEISTALGPMEVLRLLKRVEREVGRVKTFTNGPRVIDLDLVAYGDSVVAVGQPGDEADADGVSFLRVPHASVREREFVLRPLADIDPTFVLPGLGAVSSLLALVPPGDLAPIIPFPRRALRATGTPAIMAIFNATPDSFSDGAPERVRANTALERAQTLLASQPAILDIGGMSTRPGSEPCSEDEELARVVPLITALGSSVPISVDTYRASVATAAVAAGAGCINDVRGGAEPGMLAAMAAADVPVVLMHSRGDSVSMGSETSYPNGVVADVAAELLARVDAARAAGVKRWDIVLDPGLGFAKSYAQNLVLLQKLPELAGLLAGYPLLVGGSRKGFVGTATGIKVASERGPGDAAVNAICALSGVVSVLRVHDPVVAEGSVRMAAAVRDAKE